MILRRLAKISRNKFSTFKKKALKFTVQDRYLFYRGYSRDLIIRRVLDDTRIRKETL